MTALIGKRALVTAGASGIGRAITEALVEAGAKIPIDGDSQSAS